MLTFYEIGATVFGLIQGYLVMKNNRYNWIAYMIQMVFLFLFSYSVALYGDATNSLVYFFLGIIGFIVWNKKGEKGITKCSNLERVIYSSLMLIATLILYYFLNKTDDPLPLLDAFTTVSSFIATYYMMTKKIDTWIIWFFNDICYVATYFLLPDQALYLLSLNLIWTVMAVISYINWNKIMKGK